jgi:hypothetical protein
MADRPLLAVDVDGVISLFGFEGSTSEAPGRFHLINGIPHCIPEEVGGRILRLADAYEVIWASGWEDRANEVLPRILGLSAELPYLTFDGQARWGSAYWKLDALDRYAGDRPLAWIDDCLDDSCRAWAAAREAPTLLVPTQSFVGLSDELADDLLRWAEAGYTQPSAG